MHLQSGITSMMDMKVGSDDVDWKAPLSLNVMYRRNKRLLLQEQGKRSIMSENRILISRDRGPFI
jgi:hypothetical protein